jgi:long-chain fatty acid transport protein
MAKAVRFLYGTFACLLFFLFLSSSANALIVYQGNQTLNFSFRFNNPGARANGMGGAFIAVADDASAAYTNPAGLTVLTRPEVALEVKSTQTTTPVRQPISFSGATQTYSVSKEDETNTVYDASFVSFSYPMERANITVFRHQLVNSSLDYDMNILYGNSPGTPQQVNAKLKVATYGISYAHKVGDSLSLGMTVGFNQFDFDSTTVTYAGSPPTMSSEGGSNNAVSGTAALLWSPTERFSIGAVYHYNPKFNFRNQAYNSLGTPSSYQVEDNFKVPDVIGLGLSYRFPFGLTLAADVNYILYSQIQKDFILSNGAKQTPPNVLGVQQSADDFQLDDAYEIHAGLEYVFKISSTPAAARAGYTFKQAHQLYWVGNPSWVNAPSSVNLYTQQMPKGDDEHVGSVGFGIVPDKNFQIDFSGSWGKFTQEYIASFVFRF